MKQIIDKVIIKISFNKALTKTIHLTQLEYNLKIWLLHQITITHMKKTLWITFAICLLRIKILLQHKLRMLKQIMLLTLTQIHFYRKICSNKLMTNHGVVINKSNYRIQMTIMVVVTKRYKWIFNLKKNNFLEHLIQQRY